MTGYHLAELNTAILKHPLDDPRMAGFTSMLEPINALAERAPGYLWRLVDDSGVDATSMRPLGENVIVNLSVWETREAFWNYVYRSDHLEFLRRRSDWFERPRDDMTVLWWIPAGRTPTLDEALDRLQALRENGPSPLAFSLRDNYTAEDAQAFA
ncbi:DUF3291 domain-containing protein [Nocardia goodfellowii]